MKYETPRYFEINDFSFCFGNNPNYKRGSFEPKYRLSYYNHQTASYHTIAFPKNITEAKKLAKEFIAYGG